MQSPKSVLEQITSSVIDWGSNFGLVGLMVLHGIYIQPVPPDLLVIPILWRQPAQNSWRYPCRHHFQCSGLFGRYAIGLYAGRIIGRLFRPSLSRRLDEMWSDTGCRSFRRSSFPNSYKLLAWMQVQEGWIKAIRIGWSIWQRHTVGLQFYSLVCGGMNHESPGQSPSGYRRVFVYGIFLLTNGGGSGQWIGHPPAIELIKRVTTRKYAAPVV